MNRKIVSHLIAGYPTMEGSFEVAKGLINGGAYALEIQIPFSDPSADGPTIEEACQKSLSNGFKVNDGFELVKRVLEYSPKTPVYIMSYASIVYTMGVEKFVIKAKEFGATGLIIPDLAYGSDEGLYECGKKHNIEIVPVLVTSVPEDRLNFILDETKPEWAYIALRGGITGTYTTITDDNLKFLQSVTSKGIKVMAGFGIQSREQIDILDPHVEASVIGSYLVRKTNEAVDKKESIEGFIKKSIEELI